MSSIYLEFKDNEIDDAGRYTDGAELLCEQHGVLVTYGYNVIVDWEDLEYEINKHVRLMHFD